MSAADLPSVRALPRSATYDLMSRIAHLRAGGRAILDLSSGDPSFDTPSLVVEAAERALHNNLTHYVASAGLPEARAAAAGVLSRHHGVQSAAGDAFIVSSAKFGVFASLAAVVEPGDEVVLIGPRWVSYEPMVRMLGAETRLVPLTQTNGYRLEAPLLRRAVSSRTRAIVVNTPANPTGRMLSDSEIEVFAAVCGRYGCWLVSDEIYCRIVFDGNAHRAPGAHPELAPRTFTVGGLSKSHAMTGWRIGYVRPPKPAVDSLESVLQNTVGCAPGFVQSAATVAMTDVEADIVDMITEYELRRNLLCKAAGAVDGFSAPPPEGALYVWIDVTGTGQSGQAVAELLLDRFGIAALPGAAFGSTYSNYIRLSYAASTETVDQASELLAGLGTWS